MKHPVDRTNAAIVDRTNAAIVDLVRSAADEDEVATILMTLVIAGGALLKGHIGSKEAIKVLKDAAMKAPVLRVKPAAKTTEAVH